MGKTYFTPHLIFCLFFASIIKHLNAVYMNIASKISSNWRKNLFHWSNFSILVTYSDILINMINISISFNIRDFYIEQFLYMKYCKLYWCFISFIVHNVSHICADWEWTTKRRNLKWNKNHQTRIFLLSSKEANV